jgi:predicted nucleic acid-binding protein
MDRVFLDANVLISAAWSSLSPLNRLWELPETELWTSAYAADEAQRNLGELPPHRLPSLQRLLSFMHVVPVEVRDVALPHDLLLVEKDRPILAAAVATSATHLLTGDKRHFARYYGQVVAGVRILIPAEYLRSRE